MASEPKLLIIAHWFPPAGGVIVQRALSFARYLPACGYQVHVLTTRNPPTLLYDPDLLKLVPPKVHIHRALTLMPPAAVRHRLWRMLKPDSTRPAHSPAPRSLATGWKSAARDLVRRVLSPDPEVLWGPFARRQARRLIRRYAIPTVLVTAPPFSAFLIGQALKREFPEIRLISDFRDEWLRFYISSIEYHRSDWIRRRAEKVERDTVRLSDLILGTTAGIVQEIRQRYPDEPESKFACLPNGYDPELLKDFRPRPRRDGKVVIAHVGTVCQNTSPRAYFQALEMLPEPVRGDLETWLVGRIAEGEYGISPQARRFGFRPQAEAFRLMAQADYLLSISLDPVIIVAKTYEYLATGKPILGISPRGGELHRLLEQTRAGWCADPGDPEGIRGMLVEAWKRARQGSPIAPDWEAIRRYERPRLAAELARLIEERLGAP